MKEIRTIAVYVTLVLASSLSSAIHAQWSTGANGIYHNGNVGIGTTDPQHRLDVSGNSVRLSIKNFTMVNSTPNDMIYNVQNSTSYGTYFTLNTQIPFNGFFTLLPNNIGWFSGMFGSDTYVVRRFVQGGTSVDRIKITTAGAITLTGDVTVDGNIAAKYQDLAEWVPSTDELLPGTVVVLDPNRTNEVLASHAAYDTSVAGVVSETPGIVLGEAGAGKFKIATLGRVKLKVDASRRAISIGDLLVTSDKPGVAMKSEMLDIGGVKIHRPGTVVAKALEPLGDGQGEILVLLTLQ